MIIPQHTCRICNVENTHPTFVVREMMFGTREEFEYFLCNECGCLQIADIPSDLSKFYPSTYYSFNSQTAIPRKERVLPELLERLRVGNALFGRGFKLAKLASYLVDFPLQLKLIGPWLLKCNIQSFNAHFLDVGCGSSSWWLNDLKTLGFHNLLGADPYIDSDIKSGGISILKTEIQNLSDKFDLVTLHHSFEHIPNQAETLRAIRSILKLGGFCLIRIPLVSSIVWEKYGTDWVELDAPRHLYLHSLKSMKLLAKEQGLELVDFFCDSTEFEFWGSEQYRRDIPLMAEDSFGINPSKSNFTYREMAEFKKNAEEANNVSQGGRACFFLQAR
jgi:SAM-dependent methyltransferase